MYDSTARNPHGFVTIVEPGRATIEADTLQCCHCGGHFRVLRGSGTKRGWCGHCGGPTCGRLECHVCLPLEKWLRMVEDEDRKRRSELGLIFE